MFVGSWPGIQKAVMGRQLGRKMRAQGNGSEAQTGVVAACHWTLMISEKCFRFLCLLRSVSFQDICFLQELLLLHSGAGVCCYTACGA